MKYSTIIMKFYKSNFFKKKTTIKVVKIPLSERILSPHSFPSSAIHFQITTWEYTMRITGPDNYSNKVEIRQLEDIGDGEGEGVVSRATLGSKP